MKNVWVAVIILLILPSCSSSKQGGQVPDKSAVQAPIAVQQPAADARQADNYALVISPDKATSGSTVNLIINGFDARDARIDWLLNGTIIENDNPTQCRLSDAIRGDTLQARALIQGREIVSNEVEIVNALPEVISAKMISGADKTGNALGVVAKGRDADGDNVTFAYEWTVNGKPAGSTEQIGAPLKRGDKVCVRVTPSDQEGQGRPLVLNREINNQPPVIQEHDEFSFDGTEYSYQVKATDPDDDALVYSLEGAPDGMTINEPTGLITWKVPAEYKGVSELTAVVNDGNGGAARYTLKVSIK